ncbi:MAG TPA: sulfite exporter TauE/SafE family protein [Hyphomicrobiaceae bacterium]|nr:sulfite exporter TauE/SafE family protein [Hyphomicrobiaceae bacterium]
MIDAIPGLSVTSLCIAAVGLIMAGIVKGATGLGYASCALPFLVYTVGLKTAIAFVLVPAMATNIAVALGNGHLTATLRGFAPLYVAMLPGIALGVFLLGHVDTKLAMMVLGISIIAYALFSLVRPQILLPHALVGTLQVPVGLANGVLTGLTGSQVMPMVPYFLASNLEPKRMVQAINLGVTLASAVMLCGLAFTGLAQRPVIIASVVAIAPALIGVELGQRIQHYIRAQALRTAILIVLAAAGAGLILR